MKLKPSRLALALAALLCASAPAVAQSTFEAPPGSGQRFQGTIPINPVTGQPANAPIAPGVAGSAASSLILKGGPGALYNAYATCTAACWLMIFNASSAPADGATTAGNGAGNLQDCIPIAAGGTNGISYAGGPGEAFSVGVTAVISSTACGTKTAATTGFIHGTAQ